MDKCDKWDFDPKNFRRGPVPSVVTDAMVEAARATLHLKLGVVIPGIQKCGAIKAAIEAAIAAAPAVDDMSVNDYREAVRTADHIDAMVATARAEDEGAALRARIADLEAEKAEMVRLGANAHGEALKGVMEIELLHGKIADVEAERDSWRNNYNRINNHAGCLEAESAILRKLPAKIAELEQQLEKLNLAGRQVFIDGEPVHMNTAGWKERAALCARLRDAWIAGRNAAAQLIQIEHRSPVAADCIRDLEPPDDTASHVPLTDEGSAGFACGYKFAADEIDTLKRALRSCLYFIEDRESELGAKLNCGNSARTALASRAQEPHNDELGPPFKPWAATLR